MNHVSGGTYSLAILFLLNLHESKCLFSLENFDSGKSRRQLLFFSILLLKKHIFQWVLQTLLLSAFP